MKKSFKRCLSVLLVLCLMAILMPVQSMFVFAADNSDPYTFQDAAVESAIRNLLGKSDADPITYGEMRNIDQLSIYEAEITQWDDLLECTSLTRLYFYHCTLPDGALSLPTSILALELENCTLSLTSDIFDGLDGLTSLSLSSKTPIALPAGIFDELTDLTNLRISGFSSLPAAVFDQQTQLTNLEIVHNRFSSLPDHIFDELTGLTSLSLSGNYFASLPSGIFNELNTLTYLNLSYNKTLSLSSGLFDGLVALTNLNLSNCNLASLPDDLFDGLSALSWLDISNNRFATLPSGIFEELGALTTLNLQNNVNPSFSLTNGVFDGLSNLYQLNIENNGLTSLPSGVFAGLTNLQYLHCAYNRFTTLPSGIFDDLTSLTQLTLYNGALETLPEDIFDELSALCYLSLSENKIETLPAGIFSGLTKLYSLDLSRNRLRSLPNNIFKTQATQLLSSVPGSINYLQIDLCSNLLGALSSRWFGYASLDSDWVLLLSKLDSELTVNLAGNDASASLWANFSVGVGDLTEVNASAFSHDRFKNMEEEAQELILTLGSLLWKYSPESLLATPAKALVEDIILYGSHLAFKASDGAVDIKNYDELLVFLKDFVLSNTDIFNGHEDLLDDLITVLDDFLNTMSINALLQRSVKEIVGFLVNAYIEANGTSDLIDMIKDQILDLGRNNLDSGSFLGNILSQSSSLDEAIVLLIVELLGVSKTKAEEYYEAPIENVVLEYLNDRDFVLNEIGFPIAVQADSILEWAVKFVNTLLGTNFTADMDCVTIVATIFSMVEPPARYPFIYIWQGIPTGIATQTLTVEPQMDDMKMKSAGLVRPGGTVDPLSFAKSGNKWNVSLPAQNGLLFMKVEMYYEGDLEKYYDIDGVTEIFKNEMYDKLRYERRQELVDGGMDYWQADQYLYDHFDGEFAVYLANDFAGDLSAHFEDLRTADFYFFAAMSVPDPKLNSMRMSNVNGVIDHDQKTITFEYSKNTNIKNLLVNSLVLGEGCTYELSNDGKDFSGRTVTLTIKNFDGSETLVYKVIVKGGSIVLNTPLTGDSITGLVLCLSGLTSSALMMLVLLKKKRRMKAMI